MDTAGQHRHTQGEAFLLTSQPTGLFTACYSVINFSTRFNCTLHIGGYTLHIMKLLPQKIGGINKEHNTYK